MNAIDALRAVLESDVGRQTLQKLADGQGTDTPDGRAWLAANALLQAPQPSAWPATRDIARLEDMSPNGHLRVLLDTDNDVLVEVFDGQQFASVEFCSPGAGGGQSARTRMALIGVMKAMLEDNAQKPHRAHPRFQ
jgi:hypothetical protein